MRLGGLLNPLYCPHLSLENTLHINLESHVLLIKDLVAIKCINGDLIVYHFGVDGEGNDFPMVNQSIKFRRKRKYNEHATAYCLDSLSRRLQ